MSKKYTELTFEYAIEDYLLKTGGYQKTDSKSFNSDCSLFTQNVLSFIKETQPKEWEYLERIRKDKAETILLRDLCSALDSEQQGCLWVLRHGFKCSGRNFHIAYFAPASGMNPHTQALYAANQLSVTRQLRYSSRHGKTLDVTLSLNGIPVATVELKNAMTGQTWSDAIHQYKNDRDPSDLIFKFRKRTLVHFAVDTDEVYMTTKLSGKDTYFLPFNRGCDGGSGNPNNPDGYKTAYLWRDVLERDSFLDILAHFIHLQNEEKKSNGKHAKSETMIFPRYHQLDCVRKVVNHARSNGTGNNYLVQHSAGSGKSNSIAWLVYHLATLYNDNDEKIYDSVIVVTDRIILDQQLQTTIDQFEHKKGMIQKIDTNSAQLADALSATVPIIITTLQKFPYATEKMSRLKKRKYAVIIDEAHSSQSGETATKMKGVLSEPYARKEAADYSKKHGLLDHEEEIHKTMLKRGKQPNISFFAFTATPKYKTLEVFGQPGDDGKPQVFHIYGMRQAIGEGFILDVLKNYTTYKSYYHLIKSIEDDPQVNKRKAALALMRSVSKNPHNIEQKTEIIVKHFKRSTMHRIGGKAKAMVITSGRLHAVKYKQAFDKYIAENNYRGIKTLVAFSGTVKDPDAPDIEYTETNMNMDSKNKGIKETELPERFGTDEYQILLVAEKYQTGFDQPLLHTMYVDKRLADIQAVQTLSRLNRTAPGKEDTFVLDFVNGADDIQKAFQPFYEQTVIGEQVKEKQLYELQVKLDTHHVYQKTEVEGFCKIFHKPKRNQTDADHAHMNAYIDPAVSRFKQLKEDVREEFRKELVAFSNLYVFMAHIIPFQDSDLEKLYSYIRLLLTKLPRGTRGPVYNFDDNIALEYYRIEKINEGSIMLEEDKQKPISGPTAVGTGSTYDDEIELSKLIDILNELFGTEFKPGDQLFFESIREDAVAKDELRQAAKVNPIENFRYVFNECLKDLLIDRMDQNKEITKKFMDEDRFRKAVNQHLLKEVYNQIRKDAKVANDK